MTEQLTKTPLQVALAMSRATAQKWHDTHQEKRVNPYSLIALESKRLRCSMNGNRLGQSGEISRSFDVLIHDDSSYDLVPKEFRSVALSITLDPEKTWDDAIRVVSRFEKFTLAQTEKFGFLDEFYTEIDETTMPYKQDEGEPYSIGIVFRSSLDSKDALKRHLSYLRESGQNVGINQLNPHHSWDWAIREEAMLLIDLALNDTKLGKIDLGDAIIEATNLQDTRKLILNNEKSRRSTTGNSFEGTSAGIMSGNGPKR